VRQYNRYRAGVAKFQNLSDSRVLCHREQSLRWLHTKPVSSVLRRTARGLRADLLVGGERWSAFLSPRNTLADQDKKTLDGMLPTLLGCFRYKTCKRTRLRFFFFLLQFVASGGGIVEQFDTDFEPFLHLFTTYLLLKTENSQ
jgi:hypothetical protein